MWRQCSIDESLVYDVGKEMGYRQFSIDEGIVYNIDKSMVYSSKRLNDPQQGTLPCK